MQSDGIDFCESIALQRLFLCKDLLFAEQNMFKRSSIGTWNFMKKPLKTKVAPLARGTDLHQQQFG